MSIVNVFPHHRSGLHNYQDYTATAITKPGMVVNRHAHTPLIEAPADGGAWAVWVVDVKRGSADIETAYAVGEWGQMRQLALADDFLGILLSGSNVAIGAALAVSDGKLIPWVDVETNGHCHIRAAQAINANGVDARIIAEVV